MNLKNAFFILLTLFWCELNLMSQNSCNADINTPPFFYENFGEGTGFGSALDFPTTTYEFVEDFPEEGQYTIYDNTFPGLVGLPGPDTSWPWHLSIQDWNSINGETSGKMMLINANEESEVIYQTSVSGLCGDKSYIFSAWIASLYNLTSEACDENGGQGIAPNLKFEVWNVDQHQLLAEMYTDNIANNNSLEFFNYSLQFTTLGDEDGAVVKILNNNIIEGCGADIAIDEIKVELCGWSASISSPDYEEVEVIICSEETPVNLNLNLNYEGPENYIIRWQMSDDGVTWTDVPFGESYQLNVANVTTTSHFRVRIAESIQNMYGSECYWLSNIFIFRVVHIGTLASFSGNPVYCGDGIVPTVAPFPVPGISIDWYDSPQGGNLLASNTVPYTPSGPGTFYAEAYIMGTSCVSEERTPFTITWEPGVEVPPNPDPITICGGQTIELDAVYENASYQWIPDIGDTQIVTVTEPGLYKVLIDNGTDCTGRREFEVVGYYPPLISNVSNYGNTVEVAMEFEDDFYYSLDAVNWQQSNIFENVSPGLIEVYVKDGIDCGYASKEYLLLSPPKFFTPNNDGFNDSYEIKGIEQVSENIQVYIYNRFGKLLTILNRNNLFWDGTFNDDILPNNDYWYIIKVNGQQKITGHFSLKR